MDAVGEGVTDISVGDRVVGMADYAGAPIAGASDCAILNRWARVPASLDLVQAAALPMATETAFRSLEGLGMNAGQTVLIHGAGTMMGFAAVQMALQRGARVFATAGATYAGRLQALGAKVTTYGAGMVERILELAGGPIERALDTAPPSGALPDLVQIVGGEARRVFTISDFAEATKLGVRHTFSEGTAVRYRYDVLGEFVQRAAEGKFTVPIGKTFALEDWRQALDISQSGHAHGKLMLLPRSPHD